MKHKPIIGYLALSTPEANATYFEAFKEGLLKHGWRVGTNCALEGRWAASKVDRLPVLAQELARHRPVLIVAAPNNAVAAVLTAAPGVPVVQANGGDPVTSGYARSLAHPGGMVTGLSNVIANVSEKLLELLLAAVPKVRRVGFLYEARTRTRTTDPVELAQRGTRRFNIQAHFAGVTSPEAIEAGMAKLAGNDAQALVVMSGSFFPGERKRIVGLAANYRWPMIAGIGEFAEDGALLAYGASRSALYRRAAYYVDRILKGAKPGELPIEEPTQFELILNKRTAAQLGITIPQDLLVRADKVIE